MGREQALELRPQGRSDLATDEVRHQLLEEPRGGAVPAETLEPPPAPPGQLLDAVDGHQIRGAQALQPAPVLPAEAPALAAEAQAQEPPSLGLQTLLELLEQGRLAAALGPDEGGAAIEPRQALAGP